MNIDLTPAEIESITRAIHCQLNALEKYIEAHGSFLTKKDHCQVSRDERDFLDEIRIKLEAARAAENKYTDGATAHGDYKRTQPT